MKTITFLVLSILMVSCGKVSTSVGSKGKKTEPVISPIKNVALAGVHTGESWSGKVAVLSDAEFLGHPAYAFDILSSEVRNPCMNSASSDLSLLVTVMKDPSQATRGYDRYINFYSYSTSSSVASPTFKYELVKEGSIIKKLGIAYHMQDRDYDIEGFVNVVDCRTKG